MKVNHPVVWTWRITGGLCHYAEPSAERLLRNGKPSPEATLVRVRLVPVREYRARVQANQKRRRAAKGRE